MADFVPSKLGTKKHWDEVYAAELVNFDEIGDEGEIWFGEDTVAKMVNWCLKNMPPENHPSVLEVGSGNGILLLNLAENGYEPSNMLGVDYSVDAVELARKVASIRDTRFASIQYSSCDFLEESVNESDGAPRSFDLVLDKGTFDAMTLAQETDFDIPVSVKYPNKIAEHLSSRGIFLITSCNFTEEELVDRFTTNCPGLKYHSSIQHPRFSFGGKSGTIVASVAFTKKKGEY